MQLQILPTPNEYLARLQIVINSSLDLENQ